jgi:hypothetical protein
MAASLEDVAVTSNGSGGAGTVASPMFARMTMVPVARFVAQLREGLKEACDADSSAYAI